MLEVYWVSSCEWLLYHLPCYLRTDASFSGNLKLEEIVPFLGNTELKVLSAVSAFFLILLQTTTAASVKEKVLISSSFVFLFFLTKGLLTLYSRKRLNLKGEIREIWDNMLILPYNIRQIVSLPIYNSHFHAHFTQCFTQFLLDLHFYLPRLLTHRVLFVIVPGLLGFRFSSTPLSTLATLTDGRNLYQLMKRLRRYSAKPQQFLVRVLCSDTPSLLFSPRSLCQFSSERTDQDITLTNSRMDHTTEG